MRLKNRILKQFVDSVSDFIFIIFGFIIVHGINIKLDTIKATNKSISQKITYKQATFTAFTQAFIIYFAF